MRWRTANNRARSSRIVCKRRGHVSEFGYGLAYGGCGTYEFCRRCGVLITKTMDDDDE